MVSVVLADCVLCDAGSGFYDVALTFEHNASEAEEA
jgi:hypothetical protein